VGIYGVVSGFVVQRTGEIGVRMALGAQGRDILALVLGQGFRLALLGILAGLIGAAGMGRVLHAIFPNMLPAENLTTAGVTVLLFGVALLACWLPARRATRVNPIEALRAE
jgi:ABC-type antimicrobial peptide transport system permease subunit